LAPSESASWPEPWLIRVSETFEVFSAAIIEGLGAVPVKKLGSEYYWIQTQEPTRIHESEVAKYLRWNLPLEHVWPCNPEKMDGFVEKAAQAIFRKFGARAPQALFIGQTDSSASNRYYKTLASNLRGRTLQLFPKDVAALKDVEAQHADKPSVFCLLGKEGLFCGMQSPQGCKGFFPGGTKFISQNSPDTISRAGAKIAEALHFMRLFRRPMKKGSHWLELGASPGGMTSELLAREYKVTAIDRAPLDKRLEHRKDLNFALLDVAAFRPNPSMIYDAILCDMNGDARESMRQVARLTGNLRQGGWVIFTLKTPGVTTFEEMEDLHRFALETARAAGLSWLVSTHLTYNRHELSLFFELPKSQPPTA
jgi:23S rRNA (cytidine2498-2'-O)-methyltransferase